MEMGDIQLRRYSRPIFNVDNPNYGNQSNYNPKNKRATRNQDNLVYGDVVTDFVPDIQPSYLNYCHRTTSVHRNVFKLGDEPCNFRNVPFSLEHRKKWLFCSGYNTQKRSLQECADDIATCMELDDVLMNNSHESELLRREALRDMPQSLTVKRIIKKNLSFSVNKRTKEKPIGFFKGLQYTTSMKLSKVHTSLKSFAYSFELWYSSLKEIEGHFGSGVATYFKYFRWMFIMNCLIMLVALVFVVIPQLLYENFEVTTSTSKNLWFNWNIKPKTKNNATFQISDLFTGEGYFEDTVLFYGHYTNESVNLISTQWYSVPYAYFFTSVFIYVASFIVFSLSMAKSYRRSFIETQDGLKNNFAHKVFCGWDYSVATEKAANIKVSSLYTELKELLSESFQIVKHVPFLQQFYTVVLQFVCNVIVIFLLGGVGYMLWLLLNENTAHLSQSSSSIGVIIAVVINIIMLLFPLVFGFIVRYEDYKHPRAALYVTLLRTFLLKVVLVGTFLGFWLKQSTKQKCWETAIGQHIFRLILFDFFFSIVLTSVVEAVCYSIYTKLWRGIGAPTFDIARYTLQLLYNQTLFWVGFYFSPLLAVVVVIKLWLSWYIRRTCTLKFCKPYSKSWKAAQTQTLFLILSFLSLLLVIITLGYIVVDVKSSACGPMRNYTYMYELILKGIFQLEQHNVFWRILMYFTKPGAVALMLLAMCVVVYYLRAKAIAQKGIVDILRDMLVLEAKDKEFLLRTFSKVADQCNLPNEHKVYTMYENVTDIWSAEKCHYRNGNGNDCGSSTETSTTAEVDELQATEQSLQLLKENKPPKKHR
ncbi:hypothetical protein PPYR_13284 [Photinus pyralis]|uniref:TMC domain-containing protein n=3 Tax=Photinus pyralis TaxID=7054 RepID=A0A5N4A8M0_PHOPY|nr:transmembrane channel-like protein 7 isoform X1 [Photinus pyralis]KAB0793664.1 hypothetical protein PPYR_13284 [Photinus pyralis]